MLAMLSPLWFWAGGDLELRIRVASLGEEGLDISTLFPILAFFVTRWLLFGIAIIHLTWSSCGLMPGC